MPRSASRNRGTPGSGGGLGPGHDVPRRPCHGRWLKVPPTLCLLLGYTEEELLASSFKDVSHPHDFEADWSQRQRLIRGEIRSFDLEQRYIRKDGRILWVYMNCSIVADAGGQPVHFLDAVLCDITGGRKSVG